MKSIKIKPGKYYDMSDEEYHAQQAPEDHYYSSSQLKDILKDPKMFKDKYITGDAKERGFVAAFELGTYVHTAVLEPDKLEESTAVYEGAQRRGKEWEAFQKKNKGKTILVNDPKKVSLGAETELSIANGCIEAVEESEIAQQLLSTGMAEVSLFTVLDGVRVKVRADWLKLADGSIVDLKTTSSDPRDPASMRKSTKDYSYDLSAALYLDAFTEHNTSSGESPGFIMDKFYWIYAGKKTKTCQCYKATEKMLELGRAKYKEAIRLIKYYESINWEIPEECLDLDPAAWEVSDWDSVKKNSDIKKKENDIKPKAKVEPVKKKGSSTTKKRRRL